MTRANRIASTVIRLMIALTTSMACAAVFILLAALVVRLTGAAGTAMVVGVAVGTTVPTCAACWFLQPVVDRFSGRLTDWEMRRLRRAYFEAANSHPYNLVVLPPDGPIVERKEEPDA